MTALPRPPVSGRGAPVVAGKVIDYRGLIARLTEGFVGRQWVRDAVDEFLSAEAPPHHFTLTDACCASYDPVFKVNPPLRTEADVAAVRTGLGDGTICLAPIGARAGGDSDQRGNHEHGAQHDGRL